MLLYNHYYNRTQNTRHASYSYLLHAANDDTTKSVDLAIACDGFPSAEQKSSVYVMVDILIAEVLFKQFLIRTAV